jgi:hypothetical protein
MYVFVLAFWECFPKKSSFMKTPIIARYLTVGILLTATARLASDKSDRQWRL